MARQQQPARLRLLHAILALSAFVGLFWPATAPAEPAATSFTVAADTVMTIRPDFSSEKLVKARITILGEAAVSAVGERFP